MEENIQEIYSKRKFVIEFNDFSPENYDKFIVDVNESIEHPFRELLLSSNGGNPVFIDPMKDVLEKGDFTITGFSHLFSAGFILYMYADVEKTVLDHTTGAFHYPTMHNVHLNHDKSIRFSDKLDKFLHEKEVYNVDFFRELLNITNAQHKKLTSSVDEWLIYDSKQMRKLTDRSLRLLEKYK